MTRAQLNATAPNIDWSTIFEARLVSLTHRHAHTRSHTHAHTHTQTRTRTHTHMHTRTRAQVWGIPETFAQDERTIISRDVPFLQVPMTVACEYSRGTPCWVP